MVDASSCFFQKFCSCTCAISFTYDIGFVSGLVLNVFNLFFLHLFI